MAIKYIFYILLFAGYACAGDLDVRHLYDTNNVGYAPPRPPQQYFFNGESIKWDLYLTKNGAALDTTSTNFVALWEISTGPVISITSTGTCTTTNGYVKFDIIPVVLNPAAYDSRVKLYQGASYIGDVYSAVLYVLSNPLTNAAYLGPFNDNL